MDRMLALYVDMRKDREQLGLGGSTVTGRLVSGECGGDGARPGSRVPHGVRFDGLDALALYQRVDRAMGDLASFNQSAALSVLGRTVHHGLPQRRVADLIGMSDRSYRRNLERGMAFLQGRLTA